MHFDSEDRTMKRSNGVTAASICVIAASVAYCGYALSALPHAGKEGFAILLIVAIFEVLFGAWGIVTGIGLMRLRRWAWTCVVVISALMILFDAPKLWGAPKLIRATIGVPTVSSGNFVSREYVGLAIAVAALILGIWWLAFFLRRSVRAQFSPAAILAGSEATTLPVRSGAVDASAIVLLFGSALITLGAVAIPFSSPTAFPSRGIFITTSLLHALIAAWGIVTAIGALKRRAWGRILMIVTAALGIAFAVLGSLGVILVATMMPLDPQVTAADARDVIIGITSVMFIPLGISIWWVVLFTRPRIVLEFASSNAATPTAPSISLPLVAAKTAAAAPVPLQFAATVSAPAPTLFAQPQIPLSIRVIAVVEILLGVLALIAPLNVAFTGMKPPLLIFGFLVHGWGVYTFYIVSGAAPILFGAIILLRKRWGLDALIVFLFATIANVALFFVSPARVRFDAEMQSQMQSYMARMKMPDGSTMPPSPIFAHMGVFYGITFAITTALYAVLLYFLFTRRRAFRAACAPPEPRSSSHS